jgi:hypothetical protein
MDRKSARYNGVWNVCVRMRGLGERKLANRKGLSADWDYWIATGGEDDAVSDLDEGAC